MKHQMRGVFRAQSKMELSMREISCDDRNYTKALCEMFNSELISEFVSKIHKI